MREAQLGNLKVTQLSDAFVYELSVPLGFICPRKLQKCQHLQALWALYGHKAVTSLEHFKNLFNSPEEQTMITFCYSGEKQMAFLHLNGHKIGGESNADLL